MSYTSGWTAKLKWAVRARVWTKFSMINVSVLFFIDPLECTYGFLGRDQLLIIGTFEWQVDEDIVRPDDNQIDVGPIIRMFQKSSSPM